MNDTLFELALVPTEESTPTRKRKERTVKEGRLAVASPIVAAVEAAWHAIQERHAEVPDVVVTMAMGSTSSANVRGGMTLGHFAPRAWRFIDGDPSERVHELFVGAEGLNRGAADVMGTLLHEATHALAEARTIKDTSRRGAYHNTRFKKLAEEELGIVVEHSEKLGWSTTTLGEGAAFEYADEIEALEKAILASRGDITWSKSGGDKGTTEEPDESEAKKKNNGVVLVCNCQLERGPRKIRLSVGSFEWGPIECSVCHEEFHEEEK